MTRSKFRLIWLLSLLFMLLSAFLLYQKAKDTDAHVNRKKSRLQGLYQERQEVSRLSTYLEKLDRLTIDETTATRLAILRHLGIENTDYTFRVTSKQAQIVGGTSVFLRRVQLEAKLKYSEALQLVDKLYKTQKILLDHVIINPIDIYEDRVKIKIEGTLYGLEKHVS